MPVGTTHPVSVHVEPAIEGRNRLTTAFRLILAIPHLILVGGPLSVALVWGGSGGNQNSSESGAGGGLVGLVAGVCALIAWFAIIFTGRHPPGLWKICAFYLRWRVRAAAYTALLRDEYPPFGDGPYAAALELPSAGGERNRLTVAFRIILVLPHLILLIFLGFAWGITSILAWFAILFTGRFPEGLYRFGVGVLQWNIRVESYVLLLHDEYPPFTVSLDART